MMSPRRITYVASEKLAKTSSLLPSNRNRSSFVHALITSFGILRAPPNSPPSHIVAVLRPSPASWRDLAAYHDRSYVDALLADPPGPDSASCKEFGLEDDCPPFPGLGEYVLGIAGASLTAARELAEGRCDVAICWDGGRHHAHKSLASGFCYVNDCVLALLVLRRAPPLPPLSSSPGIPRKKSRVMYLDIDVHYGDGVAAAFRGAGARGQVLTLSIHHTASGFFPPSEHSTLPVPSSAAFDPFTLSLPLHAGASRATFARVWLTVERIIAAFAPDYITLQCGVDGLAGDPVGVWNWTLGGEGGLAWFVWRVLESSAKVLLLGGGGYTLVNTARAWALLTSIACGAPLALDTPIPPHPGFPMYAPSFILDVPTGNVRDENTDEYLTEVDAIFELVADALLTQLA
ncbi:histone deacetylase complex protein [Multifurca ochricompacta]|uniref:Histone deacetylase 8 n=1 Tax=Multifurca ochricompacta TaxID=376703 RepID=A0AAD4M525_9AGAM|nr:histone deacetylase complex protein [Multifurca ochricompacta]